MWAEVAVFDPVNVSVVGLCYDNLALVDELLKAFFVGISPGLYCWGVIVHGQLADLWWCGVWCCGVVCCCVIVPGHAPQCVQS